MEAETLEDETRRLQDEKEERVKRLETLNAQAGGNRYQVPEKKGPVLLVRGFVGDEILSSYTGIIRNYFLRIPSLSNQDSMEIKSFVCFFRGGKFLLGGSVF